VEQVYEVCRAMAEAPVAAPLSERTTEQLGLVAHHLFRGQDDAGMYMRLKDVMAAGPQAIADGAARMFARKSPPKPVPENASDKLASEAVEAGNLPVTQDVPAKP
jgi:hypothetical protein